MDIRYALRNIIVVLVGLGLIVLVIVLLVKGFSSGPSKPTHLVDVSKYADTPAVSTLLMDGPTNLDQDHYQVKITVSNTTNEIDVIRGYQGSVIRSQTYVNNSSAYASFLQSLQLLGFSKGTNSTVDYRGFCPTGDRYIYSFNDGQTDLFSYWSASCGGQGTFQGSAQPVRNLFERQINTQDLVKITSGTNVTL